MNTSYTLSWMNPKLAVQETGRYGKGVFVKRGRIRKREVLFVLGGNILTLHDESRLRGSLADKPIEIADRFSVGPRCASDLARMPQHYVNHSCVPNAGFRGGLFLVAMRPILRGEEITYDYAMVLRSHASGTNGFKLQCRCGARHCRGVITGNEWKSPDIQRRYAGYFQWYLQEKIDALKPRRRKR